MIKPLNFAYRDGKVYFHTAREGEKIDDIKRDNRVCFEVDLPIAYVEGDENPCKASYLYRSVIIKGRAVIVEDKAEKIQALGYLMEKYQPEGGYDSFPEEKLKITGIVRIDIEEMTGKEDLGKGETREAVLRVLEKKIREFYPRQCDSWTVIYDKKTYKIKYCSIYLKLNITIISILSKSSEPRNLWHSYRVFS